MAKAYGLTQKDRDGLRKLIKQVGAGNPVLSRRPVPTRRRNRGGGSRTQAIFAIVATTINAAGGDTSEITPGTGTAYLYDTNPADGVRTPRMSGEEQVEVEVRNYDPDAVHATGVVVYLAASVSHDGTQYYEVISASCTAFPPPEPEE